MKRAAVLVPASTANLGPGFDSLALALSLHNRVELEFAAGGFQAAVEGEGAATLPVDGEHLGLKAALRLFEAADIQPAGLRLRAANAIPLASGLGSSAAAIVGGLAAANMLLTEPVTTSRLLRLAFGLEGHADNAAAALLGGLVAVAPDENLPVARRIETPPLRVAVAVPELALATAEMRRALPARVPLEDAVFNLGRSLLTVEALRSGDYELLAHVMKDRLHERHRAAHIPGYPEAVAAALAAGAAAATLSGAGPGVVAFAPTGHPAIAEALEAGFARAGLAARTFVLDVDPQGVRPPHADAHPPGPA